MNKAIHIGVIISLIGFSTWLFFQEKEAEPGALRLVHEDNTVCSDCHQPWRPVDDSACVGCHSFPDDFSLRPAIRFHTAEEHCLDCHTEHRGRSGNISRMDHTLLNPDLHCSTCHLDPHEQLFGEDCRACHEISTWSVAGYRHPSAERHECSRCHRAPLSHQDPEFWPRIQKGHTVSIGQKEDVKPADCWKCHVLHDWRHMKM